MPSGRRAHPPCGHGHQRQPKRKVLHIDGIGCHTETFQERSGVLRGYGRHDLLQPCHRIQTTIVQTKIARPFTGNRLIESVVRPDPLPEPRAAFENRANA